MRKYITPNGTIVTDTDVINRYGEQEFQSFLQNGKLQEVDEDTQDNIYVTPNNTEVTETDVINKYGEEAFRKFLTEGQLKKKEDTVLSSEDGSSDSQTTEEDYFTGAFGNALRGLDSIIPLGIGDFVDDMARSVAQGARQGIAAENASDLLLRGSSASLEDIQSFIDSQKDAAKIGPSKEMQDYLKTYEDNGKGFMGVVLGLAKNPSILAEVALSSMTSMATNTDAWLAAGSVLGAGAGAGTGAGAAVGSIVPLAGTAAGAGVGAAAGFTASIIPAFAAAGSALEMGSTFAELLTEAADGRELTKEVVQELLNDPEVYKDIRNKAVGRGIVIGAIDAFTGKLGGKIGSKVLTKGGNIASDVATKGRKAASIAAAGGVEAVGGSLGEVGGRLAAGQEMDASEIALEGIAEAPGSIKDMIAARYAKPTYKVNGEKVTAGTLDDLINTMTLEQLQSAKIDIENDYEGRAGKLQNRLEELSTKKQIREANPEINEPTLNEMTTLQLELNKLEGNKTEVAKTKVRELKEKIQALQETPLTETVVDTTIENALAEFDPEEEFAQLTEDDKAIYLEQANGDEQSAINLFAEDLKFAEDLRKAQEETLTMPTEEQQLADIQNGDISTFEYNNESEVPEVFKDKISSRGETNGKPFVRVTVAKSLADFHLQDRPSTTVSSRTQVSDNNQSNEISDIRNKIEAIGEEYNSLVELVNKEDRRIGDPLSDNEKKLKEVSKNMFELQDRLNALEREQEVVSSKTQETTPTITATTTEPIVQAEDNIVKFIKDARGQGISEAAIKVALKRKGISDEAIVSGIEKSKSQASIRTEVTEDLVEGYDRMMEEVDGIVAKSEKRGRSNDEILNNITEYIMGSKVYENATDVQREKLVRDARKRMGKREKSAPSAKRLIGIIKDIKNITMSEKELLYNRLKALEEGAKTAKQAWMNVSKQLAEEIDELQKKGKITASQMADVITKFSKVNMFNPTSVERFIDYMANVFNDADYANKIENANRKRKSALANIGTKIGISDTLAPKLQRIFSINPSLIPMSVLDKYLSLLNTFSQRKAVLSLPPLNDMIALSDEVLDALDEEQSMVFDLADRFNSSENKKYNEDGSLNYADTIKEMFKNGEISEEELAIMKKYKSQIIPSVDTELTDEQRAERESEIEAQRIELIRQIDQSDAMQISSLPSRDERDRARRLEKLLRTDALKSLSVRELENVLRVLDNINNGYFPHYAQLVIERLNSINNGEQLTGAIEVGKPLPFTAMYARLKSIVTKKGSIQEMVRRNPLFYIDQVFGNFKTKEIFNSVFGMASEEVSKFRSELKSIQDKITKAEQAVINSFGKDHNKFVMSKYKQMAYMIQEEFLSNPDSNQVNNVSDFLKATIKRIDEETTSYTNRDADMLQKILDTYTDANGKFDNQALYDSFNDAEKRSIKTLQEINLELGPKAVTTAAIIRGDKIKPLENYVHLNVLNDSSNMDEMSVPSFVETFNNSLRPSTRAKSLIERTGKVSALNFDVYSSVQKGAKFVLMDYHLTEPIRTARRTINQAEKNLSKDGRMDSDKRKIFNAIKNAFEESTSNLLENSFTETSIADDILNYVKKQGYRAILTSVPRFMAELVSNIGAALFIDPKGFMSGVKLRGFITSPEALQAMNNLNSVQTNRVFPNESLSGRIVDTNGFNETKGTKGGKARGTVKNYISKLWSKTGQRWVNGVEVTADALISTPDKLMVRPMWFGAFENRFKDITGNSPDFEKIAQNDEAYMNENKEALKEATELADKRSVMAGATENAFMGMLKGTAKPNQKVSIQAFNAFNNFMTRFLIFEYITARAGIMAMVNRGEMSQRQGAAVIGGVMTRMVLYTLVGQMMAEAMVDMLDGDDEEKEPEVQDEEPKTKSFEKKLGQAFASAFTSLLFGRDFGNATKGMINIGVEEFNKAQLDFLRDGDYDPYKDAIQYTITPIEKKGKQTGLGDFLMKFGAAYGPTLKTADLIIRKTLEPDKTTEEAKKRQEDERYVRIPLEILGNLGFIPMYKDVRKVVLQNIYKDLENAERDAKNKKKAKEEMLQGYENETDMKRYDRELWERTFGPNSPNYDEIQAKKEIDRQRRLIRQQLKDEMYDYTPVQKRAKEINAPSKRGIGGGSGIGGRR